MVKQCYICRICSYQPEAQNLSFYRFPANPEKKNLWISRLGFEEGKQYPKIMHVCSRHFRQSDVQSRDDGTRYLRDSALPLPLQSLFESHENKRVDNVDGCSTEVKVEPICDYDTGVESAEVASTSLKFINQMKTEPIEDHDIDLGPIQIQGSVHGISGMKEEPIYETDAGVSSVKTEEAIQGITEVKEEPVYKYDPGVSSVNVDEAVLDISQVSKAVPGIIQVKEEQIYSYGPGVASVKLENITQDVSQVKEEPVYYLDLGMETVKMEYVSDSDVNGIKEEPVHDYVTETASSGKRSFAESMSSDDFYMREYKRKIKRIKESIVRRRKRVCTLQKTVRRLQQRVVELESDVSQLLRENSSLPESMIEASLSGSTEVLEGLLNGASTKKFNCLK